MASLYSTSDLPHTFAPYLYKLPLVVLPLDPLDPKRIPPGDLDALAAAGILGRSLGTSWYIMVPWQLWHEWRTLKNDVIFLNVFLMFLMLKK